MREKRQNFPAEALQMSYINISPLKEGSIVTSSQREQYKKGGENKETV